MKRGLLIIALFVLIGIGCSMSTVPAPATSIPVRIVVIVTGSTHVPTATYTFTPTDTFTPTNTFTPTDTFTPSNTFTPTDTLTPSNTPLPSNTPTITPTPQPIAAQLCQNCKAHLRKTPGTAGRILSWIEYPVEFNIIGRTDDGKWAEIVLKKGDKRGWISAEFIDPKNIDLKVLAVSGTAIEASATPTGVHGAPLVVSNVTSHARQIFLRGQSMGNRANVFSRVGDSITASPYFLTPFGAGGYDLGDYSNELTDVVGYFSRATARTGNSFTNASLAAGNGWGADRIIQPGWAYTDVCGSDSPLVCEYKHVKPAVALIMIGTNDSGGISPEQFAANLRQIVQISIDMGVVPVLSTIPPKQNDDWNAQRADQWNQIIRSIAHEYDVPLMDYWFALQKAPNHGLGPDGIHPSVPSGGETGVFTSENLQFGYTIRNLTTLQMLNELWHNVLY